MDYDRMSLKTELYYFVPMYVVTLAIIPYVLFRFLPFYVAIVGTIIVIVGVLLAMESNLKDNVLGPSMYSNGISLISKNPFRFHGRFIRFSDIKLVKIGLDDKMVSDVAFLQRYVDELHSRWYKTAKEAMEDMSDSIFLVTVSGEIIRLEVFIATEEERFINILEEQNVEYVVSRHTQEMMDFLSEDWSG